MTLASLGLLLFVQSAPAATLTGTVRAGGTDAPLPDAAVNLPELGRGTRTDATGRYVLHGVPPGPLHVAVRAVGFRPRSLHALVPQSGRLEVNVALERGPVRLDAVAVRALAEPGPDGGSGGPAERERSLVSVADHPLLEEPDAFRVLTGGPVVMQQEMASRMFVHGGSSDQTAYLLDGIPILNPYHTGGVAGAWNPDALDVVRMSPSTPSPALPATLSGAVEGETRTPGAVFGVRGGASNTHARLTADGPIGSFGAAFVLSGRTGHPDVIAPRREHDYLRGSTDDALAALRLPFWRGEVRLLGYLNANKVSANAAAGSDTSTLGPGARNRFEWTSTSVGASWRRARDQGAVRLVAWNAATGGGATYAALTAPITLRSARGDVGLLAAVESRARGRSREIGVKVEQLRTAYRIASATTSATILDRRASTDVVTAFARQEWTIRPSVIVSGALALAQVNEKVHPSPRLRARWAVSERLAVTGHLARTHQFAQSLRNAESVVGAIHPADLFVGVGAGSPVAVSDLGVVAAQWHPRAGARLEAQAFVRELRGMLLVAPTEGGPFATGGSEIGRGEARGASVEFTQQSARATLLAALSVQRVRYSTSTTAYTPAHAARQIAELGVTFYPSATSTVRVGLSSAFGRRATAIANRFEWESCNLVDRGCEFAGSPDIGGETLGGVALPSYARLDLGGRKHTHLTVGGRDVQLALYATISNVLGRHNILTYARDATGGGRSAIELRRPSPVVIGLDWRF